MKKIISLFTAVAAIATALVFVPVDRHAEAATLTYTDPLCSSFTLNPITASSFTLVCNKMSCPIVANPASSALPNSPIALSATCTPAATTYTWSLVTTTSGCPAVTTPNAPSLALVSSATVTGCIYQLDASDSASGKVGQSTITVGWSTVQAPAPSGCTVSASPSSLAAGGGPVTLTASCAAGNPTSYAWTGGSIAGATTASVTTNITATTTFSVTPSNATGPGNTASVTVNVGTVTTGDEALCSANFPGRFKVITMGIGAAGQAFTYNKGGMLPDDVIAFKFAVPASTTNTVPPTFASQGTISIAEYSGGPVQRTGTLSTKACDFRGFVAGGPYPIDATGTNFPIKWNFGQSVNFNWLVSGTVTGAVTLTPGATYYVNVRNLNPDSGTGTCTLSTCDIIGSVSAPK